MPFKQVKKRKKRQVKVDQVQAGKIIIQFTHIQDIQVNQVQVPKIKIKAHVIQVHLANVNVHQHIPANQVHVNLAKLPTKASKIQEPNSLRGQNQLQHIQQQLKSDLQNTRYDKFNCSSTKIKR